MTNKFFDKNKYNELVIGSPFDSGDKKQVLKKINQGSGLGTGRISIDNNNSLNNEKEPSMIQINKLNLNIQDLKSKYNDLTETPNKEKNQTIINKMLSNRLSINTDLYQ